MQNSSAEYICRMHFDHLLPDESAWRSKLAEFGLHHEAFTFTRSPTGSAIVKFWEPDRVEALRVLAKLDGLRSAPVF